MTAARGRFFLLGAVAVLVFLLDAASSGGQEVGPGPEKHVYLFAVPGVSFEEVLAVPEVSALARSGGAALMSYQGAVPTHFPGPGHVEPGTNAVSETELVPTGAGGLAAVGAAIRDEVLASDASDVLVIVLSAVPSEAMIEAKDELHPLVMASGDPASLFPADGPLHTLASHTTRRIGVVTDLDVWPTIAGFLGGPVPGDDVGSVLRVVAEPAPFALHARHLANRRMSVPIQAAAGIYVTLMGLFAVALLVLRRRVPRWLAHGAAWLALSVPVLTTGLLAAGHLPTLSYATVVPFLAVVVVIGAVAFVPLQRFGLLVPAAAIGAAVLLYFLWEAAVGWTAALTPFLGGSELDGERFYGLPNVFIGLFIGCSLWVAARLRPFPGFLLVAAFGLFVGLPGIGANLGAAVAVFAAAGLWLGLRRSGRLGWKELALAAGVIVAGTALVLAAHAFLTSTPTHGTRFVEGAGRTPSGIFRTAADRLLVGWRLIVRNPLALVPVLGVPACLLVVLRPPQPVRVGLERHPEWRDVLLVTLLAGMVAYLANDSGAAAIGQAFATGVGGLLYVSLYEQTWKMADT